MKILIIDDDRLLRNELAGQLRKNGYEVMALEMFDSAEQVIKENGFHLILLDVTLPGRSGYEICQSIRSFSEIPIIFLTSRDTDMDELYSMSLGGDDFVRKPYNMPILLARIAAVLKRSHPEMAMEKEVAYGDFSLCLAKGKLTKDGKSVELTRHELLILSYLFRHPQEIVSRVDLIEELWDNQVYIDDNTLSVNMTRLRSKLKTLGAENLIRTKYGQGYQL